MTCVTCLPQVAMVMSGSGLMAQLQSESALMPIDVWRPCLAGDEENVAG